MTRITDLALEEEILEKVDQEAVRLGLSRQAFIRLCVLDRLGLVGFNPKEKQEENNKASVA